MNAKLTPHKPALTVAALKQETKKFIAAFSKEHPELFGITDGKAVGTYVEEKFNVYLGERYEYQSGNAAVGIDFPALEVDVKATSIRQPQSSCPFRSAEQKVYGLGYNLLVFVYEKERRWTAKDGSSRLQERRVRESRQNGRLSNNEGNPWHSGA